MRQSTVSCPYYVGASHTPPSVHREGVDIAIEKAFAIHAPPADVYAALLRDLAAASPHEGEVFDVIERERDRRLKLRVTIGGVHCYLQYHIEQKPEHTEVTATLEPYGWRYVLFQFATLGLRRSSFELVLVQGLANLKAEVEGDAGLEDGDVGDHVV